MRGGRRPVRPWVAALFLTGALALLTSGGARAQIIVGEHINSYDVDIRIRDDGSLLVVERIDYDFDSLERHGIFRDIPVRFEHDERYDRVYPIEEISVEGSPGTPDQFETSDEGSLLRIKIGDPDRTITGRHVYTITYRVDGALNGFAGHDELYWNAIGTEWTVPIENASARVTAPARITRIACYSGSSGSGLLCAKSGFRGSTATFRQPELGAYQGLTVVIAIPKGVVPRPSPVLEERWSLARAFAVTPLSVGLGLPLLLLVAIGLGRLMWVTGRDRRAVGEAVDVAFASSEGGEQAVPLGERGSYQVEYAPPEDVRPGQVGTLVDEVAGPLDVTATIVDLAVRGYLRIEEIPKKGFFGKADWRLVKVKEADQDLLEYERMLFNGLFEDAEDDEAEDPPAPASSPSRPDLASVRLSGLKKKFAERLNKVENALYDDAVKRKWFAGRPDKVRSKWASRGWILFLVGGALVWLAAAKTHLGLVPIPIVLGGLFLIWGAHLMPRRTAKGTGLTRRVLGFRRYIDTAEIEEARFAERENLFSKYLPYAVVFGLTEKWARAFAGLDEQVPTTGWYVGPHPFTAPAFASSMDDFTVTTAGTITSTPAASGSSGFGGGGSSGGGGGGGGGGSW